MKRIKTLYVTRSRGNESLVDKFQFCITSKCFILMQIIPLKLNIWSYDEFINAKNNIKQKNLNTVFVIISKTLSPTLDSFLLIMSHVIISSLLPSIFVFGEQRTFEFEHALASQQGITYSNLTPFVTILIVKFVPIYIA